MNNYIDYDLRITYLREKQIDDSIPNHVTIFDCSQVSEIPQSECEALVILYQSTDGPNWAGNIDWLVTNRPCSWSGVVCQQGHVYEVVLDGGRGRLVQ